LNDVISYGRAVKAAFPYFLKKAKAMRVQKRAGGRKSDLDRRIFQKSVVLRCVDIVCFTRGFDR
jgi:hypothetical protein